MLSTKEFNQCVGTSIVSQLGEVVKNVDVASSMGPFQFLPGYQVQYPKVVVQALAELYMEYNAAFGPLVKKNMEWKMDYRYLLESGTPMNFAVQVDMVGLSDSFLDTAANSSKEDVKEVLRKNIYEIENSVAMYQLLENLFAKKEKSTFFKERFRTLLADLREKHGKKIALLAVTDEKYHAMKQTEFGVMNGSIVTNEAVKRLSGFDRFFSPEQFIQHLEETGGECDYLLYARTSDPVDKLRKPKTEIEHPLLGDPKIRRIIKENVITFNVDAPEMEPTLRINDTKEYMPTMNMAFPIETEADLFSTELIEFLQAGESLCNFSGKKFLSTAFVNYLLTQDVDPMDVVNGKTLLRAKPMKCAYGCYGHIAGEFGGKKFRSELRRNLRARGSYVIQPEMLAPVITNETDGRKFTFIDRNFFACVDGKPQFLGGFRSLMPLDSMECEKGRNHGNGATVWGEIVV